MILHLDLDAFFASVEQAANPRLKGKPLIVGSRGNKYYTVVCAASYEAKRLGIDSGMPTKDAFKICPNAEFVTADSAKYIWTSRQIYQMLFDYSPNPVYASVDEFDLDVTEVGAYCPSLRSGSLEGSRVETRDNTPLLIEEIRSRIQAKFKITASIGVGQNWLLAKLASKINKPNSWFIFTPENLEPTLASLPVEKICGVGPSTLAKLNQLGIRTCLDFYQAPVAASSPLAGLGETVFQLWQGLHRIEKLSLFSSPERPKSIGHSYTLPRSEKDPQIVLGWLRLLAEMVASRLRQKGLAGQTIHLNLGFQNSGFFSRQKTFSEPVFDGFEIASRCLKICTKLSVGAHCNTPLPLAPIRFLGISVSGLQAAQKTSLLPEVQKRGKLLETQDRLNRKFGDWTVFPAQVLAARNSKKP